MELTDNNNIITINTEDHDIDISDIIDSSSPGAISISGYDWDLTQDVTFSHKGKDLNLSEEYEKITTRLEVVSDIIDEIIEMYPEHRERLDIETRIQQKLMLKKLAGE